MLRSRLCTQDQFQTGMYIQWCRQLQEQPRFHRKLWEFCYICQSLWERGMLVMGNKGLGFGVGQEPLPGLFASYGCQIVGTDLDEKSAQDAGWAATKQHMASTQMMNQRGICQQDAFDRLVTGRVVDMNRIPPDLRDFDFVWSSCSLEHLGSIDKGLDFIVNSIKCLRPGGVAVHTTEFNVSSNTETLDTGGTVLFRHRDFKDLVDRLTAAGHHIDVSYDLGQGPADYYVDVPPYTASMHLKLKLDRYVTTSIGLIICKGGIASEVEPLPQNYFREYAPAPPAEEFGVRLQREEKHAVYINDHTAIALVLGRFKMFVDTRDLLQSPHLLLDGFYDLPRTELLQRLVKPGMTVVDVGANCGYFSLLAADLVGSQGRVHSMEAVPDNLRLLQQSVALNGFGDHLHTHQASLLDGGDNAENKRVAKLPWQDLDDLFLSGTRVDFVRIGIEGYELLVLDGMKRIMRKEQPILLIELNEAGLDNEGRPAAEELLGLIGGKGYVPFDVNSFLSGEEEPYELQQESEHLGIRHLICIPSPK